MTEEQRYGRALSIIYDPKDCPHRDVNDRCHHKDNLDNRCSRIYAGYPRECPLKKWLFRICVKNAIILRLNLERLPASMGYLLMKPLVCPDRPSCDKWEGSLMTLSPIICEHLDTKKVWVMFRSYDVTNCNSCISMEGGISIFCITYSTIRFRIRNRLQKSRRKKNESRNWG